MAEAAARMSALRILVMSPLPVAVLSVARPAVVPSPCGGHVSTRDPTVAAGEVMLIWRQQTRSPPAAWPAGEGGVGWRVLTAAPINEREGPHTRSATNT